MDIRLNKMTGPTRTVADMEYGSVIRLNKRQSLREELWLVVRSHHNNNSGRGIVPLKNPGKWGYYNDAEHWEVAEVFGKLEVVG